uniref:Uncharacterized protein n=1 Tax=Plectus sambesii TaxID=2011161 RepID=A0A914VY75_9BILA
MKIQQAEEDKLSLLERNTRGVGAADAWRWYSSNREKFLRPVYVPLLCMSLKESTDARYLENIVGNRDFQMFVCGCPQDEALLQKQAHDSRWRINSTVLQMPETSEDDNGRRLPQNLAALGFRCFASQLFDAPSIVKKYLCNVAVLDRIPIGTNQTDQLLERSGDDKLMEEFARQGLKLLLTTSKRMSIVQSRYSNGCSTRVDELRDQIRWLTMHTMTSSTVDLAGKNDECKELQTRLDAKKADCAGQKTEIGRERERIRQQLRELSQRQDTKNRLQRDLETKNARLKQMMENKPDLNQATVDMETALKDLTRRSLTSIQHMADTLARIEELTHRMGSAALEHEFFKRLLAKKQLELSNHQDVGQQKLDEFTEKKREVDEVKQRVRSQLMKVYERTGLSSLNRDALPPAEVATYDAMWKVCHLSSRLMLAHLV